MANGKKMVIQPSLWHLVCSIASPFAMPFAFCGMMPSKRLVIHVIVVTAKWLQQPLFSLESNISGSTTTVQCLRTAPSYIERSEVGWEIIKKLGTSSLSCFALEQDIPT